MATFALWQKGIYILTKYGVVEVDLEHCALRDLSDDLEGVEGMLKKSTTKPYIDWSKNKQAKLGNGPS